MNFRKEIWTYVLVTVVTALVWIWAAGETREPRTVNALVHFTLPEPANWIVEPDEHPVSIDVEGSQLSLQNLDTLLRPALQVSIPAQAGRQTIDLLEQLNAHEEIRATGVSVLSVKPRLVEVEVDQIERFSAAVRPTLPGVQTEGEIVVDPQEVTVAMPSKLRQRIGQGFAVQAVIERAELDRLPPGVPQAQEVKLRLPEGFTGNNEITISPSRVKLSFTIRSRTREVTLESVRVQLAGPPEDREAYVVEIDPRQLRNVTVSAEADLSRRIESNEVPVVAILHLSSREKEAKIEAKKITCFMALVPEPGGGTRGVQLTGRVEDAPDLPSIKLNISPR